MDLVRLLVRVEFLEGESTPSNESFSAHLFAVAASGEEYCLLADRGWGSSGLPHSLAATTSDHVEKNALMVVGPDEPWGEETPDEVERAHWTTLASVLRDSGITAHADDLASLPVTVSFGPALVRRLASAQDERRDHQQHPERPDHQTLQPARPHRQSHGGEPEKDA